MHLYPKKVSEKIGFETVREVTLAETRSVMGRERVERLRPASSPETVERRLRGTAEMMRLLRDESGFPLHQLHDLREPLSSSRAEGSLLPAETLLEIRQVAATARHIKQFLSDREESYPRLKELSVQLVPLKELEDAIGKVITDQAAISDNASPELRSIRSRLNKKKGDLRTAVNRVMSRISKQGMASDEGPTIRNGRMVIPVLAEYKRKIQGFVHDVSSTGQTVYLEPVEALNINNEIRQLESEERREIERILRVLTDRVRINSEYLLQNGEALGKLDAIAAKAEVSLKLDGLVPAFSRSRLLYLSDANNPLLLLKNLKASVQNREPVVPLRLELKDGEQCLVITGPNAGGKSVALKTVGLCVLMNQSGFAIPAKDSSELPIYSGLFVDMGDDQSIEDDLSTFSSRLAWMKKTLDRADGHSLVLIDEAGAGTDPEEGGALVQAFIEKLIEIGATVLVTTHHGSLKVFAHEHPKAINGSMEFDQTTLSPTYRFKKGIPGSSYAFEIAQRMKLNRSFLDRARAHLGQAKESMETLITELENKQQEAERLKQEFEQLRKETDRERKKYEDKWRGVEKERDSIREKALREAKEIMQSANRQIEQAVQQIVEQDSKDSEEIRQARRKVEDHKKMVDRQLSELEQEKEKSVETAGEPPEVGDTVKLSDARTTGELIEKDGNKAVVLSNGLKLKTSYNKLVKVEDRTDRKKKKPKTRVNVINRDVLPKRVKPSLEIRGMRGDEAMNEVMHYLDNAIVSGLHRVEIIHGKGEGILKKLVHEYLDKRKEVKSYHLAPPDRGGAGCTIVNLT